MDKFLDREVAWRVFAHESNRSNLHVSEGDERAPDYIITPTGVKCNRLFIVGVVTEVENIGKDNNLWRTRVADPTGVFTVYAGHYQPEAAIFLSELNVPAYVIVVGKARKAEPEDGSIYTAVRPEEINNADEKLRDRWVLDTAERTLERIRLMEDALGSGLTGNELREFLIKKGLNAVPADGVVKAIGHYKNLDKIMEELKNTVIHAIKTISSESVRIVPEQPVEIQNETPVQKDERKEEPVERPEQKIRVQKKLDFENEVEEEDITGQEPEVPASEKKPEEVLADIIDKLDTGKGTPYSLVLENSLKAGMDPETVEAAIKKLMDEGRCYELKIGMLRKV